MVLKLPENRKADTGFSGLVEPFNSIDNRFCKSAPRLLLLISLFALRSAFAWGNFPGERHSKIRPMRWLAAADFTALQLLVQHRSPQMGKKTPTRHPSGLVPQGLRLTA